MGRQHADMRHNLLIGSSILASGHCVLGWCLNFGSCVLGCCLIYWSQDLVYVVHCDLRIDGIRKGNNVIIYLSIVENAKSIAKR